VTLNNQSQSVYTLHLQDDGNNNFNENLYQVCIQVLPQIDFDIPNQNFCLDDIPFQLSGGSPLGGAYSGMGVDSLGIFNPSVAEVGQHEITYTYTATSYSCSNQIGQSVVVNQLPQVNLVLPKDTFCIDETNIELTGGTPIKGEYIGTEIVDNIFEPSEAGLGTHSILYAFIDGNGCSNSDSSEVYIIEENCTSGINPLGISESIFVYPNPSTDILYLQWPKNTGAAEEVILINMVGQRYTRNIVYDASEVSTLDVSDLSTGIWLVKVFTKEGIVLGKFLKI
jgi:hypothetical protein